VSFASTVLLWVEIAAVVFAIAYLVLAIRQSQLCWPAALVSVALSLVVFYDARLYMQTALQVFYIAMAIYGWHQWRSGGAEHGGVRITRWSMRTHVVGIGAIAIMTVAFGFALAAYTDAALPYLDSFTTIGALLATYMVAKKILENWIYWFVIDSASVYLNAARDLDYYALLFVLYLVLVVIGFRRWLFDWRATTPGAAAAAPRHG
jgi:nicotinamide mononucleotide transporter